MMPHSFENTGVPHAVARATCPRIDFIAFGVLFAACTTALKMTPLLSARRGRGWLVQRHGRANHPRPLLKKEGNHFHGFWVPVSGRA